MNSFAASSHTILGDGNEACQDLPCGTHRPHNLRVIKKKKNLTQTEETRKQRNITTDKTPVFLAVENADQNSLDKHVRYTRDGTHRKHRSTTTLNLQHSVGQVDG